MEAIDVLFEGCSKGNLPPGLISRLVKLLKRFADHESVLEFNIAQLPLSQMAIRSLNLSKRS